MKSITGYCEKTSHHELYSFLAQQIVSGEINNFGDVLLILEQLPRDKRVMWVYPKLFSLVRSIYWGFLKDLDIQRYPALWKAFVIENPHFPGTGKLKRSCKILTLFSGIMDIHGYTSFCQKAGRNLSMLQLLDDCIQKDIKKIAAGYGVICQRSRGDEIILLGSKASSVFLTIMSIISYFAKKRTIQNRDFHKARTGDRIILPDMRVSAGISGGHKYTPLVITKNGDLSGHLINSSARLQARANKLAPHETKILLTRQVMTKLNFEMRIDPDIHAMLEDLYFRNSGGMEFKGTQMGVIEVITNKEELYKKKLDSGFERLYLALERKQWDRQIYEESMGLVRTAMTHMEQFSLAVPLYGKIRNTDVVALCNQGLDEFLNGNRFDKAIEILGKVRKIIRHVPFFDHLLLEYIEIIASGYEDFGTAYMSSLEKILEEKAEYLISLDMRDVYLKAKKETDTYNRIRKVAMENPRIGNRKALWLRIVADKQKEK